MFKKVVISATVIGILSFGGLGANAYASSLTDKIINEGNQLIGVPYAWGGTTPGGFDCSGFLNYVFEKNGVSLPRTTSGIYGAGESVSRGELKEGDIVFFSTYRSGPSHAGIYIGENKFIHSSTSRGVTVSSLRTGYWGSRYIGARRVVDEFPEDRVKQAVEQAVSLAKSLKPYYTTNINTVDDVVVTDAFLNDYNKATAAIKEAESLQKTVQASSFSSFSSLNIASEYRLQAARFIDSVKVGTDLDSAKAELKQFIDRQQINEEMENAYNFLSSEIRRSERAISKVYGSDNRQTVLDRFVTLAKITKETVIYEVSRYNLMKDIEGDIADQDLTVAGDKLAMLERLERRSIEIKEAGNQLYPGKYPSLPEMENTLQEMKKDILTTYESAK